MSDELISKETRDEAARWWARLNNTTITTQDLREFREWKKHGQNAEAFTEIENFWRKVGILQHDEDIQEAAQDALDRKSKGPFGGPGGRGLAGVLLAVAVGAAGAYGWKVSAGQAYETEVGEQRTVRLADGSRLQLDTDTKVRVRLTRKDRRLELARGQAFFTVAHDADRPFIVRADDAEVRALGTRFEVRRSADSIQVTLVDGKVRVNGVTQGGSAKAWVLAPGQSITVGRAAPSPAIQSADLEAATSWTSGRLVFQEQPLGAAIAEVNRYSPAKIKLTDPDLAQTPVSGVFDTGDTEAFVAAVSDLYSLRIAARDAREIRLEPAA